MVLGRRSPVRIGRIMFAKIRNIGDPSIYRRQVLCILREATKQEFLQDQKERFGTSDGLEECIETAGVKYFYKVSVD